MEQTRLKKRYKKRKAVWGIIIASVLAVSGGLIVASVMMQGAVQVQNTEDDKEEYSAEATYLDRSVLNGAPFLENDVYNKFDDKKLHYAYITVLPTVDDVTEERVTLDDLNSVISFDQNPVVNVLFQEGDDSGPPLDIYKSTVVRPNGTMKVRGFSSREAPQKSFKVVLSGVSDTFLGQETLNFNKHYSDFTRFSNKFCMDAFEKIPDMGSLDTYFVKIYIRDLSKGGGGGFVDYGLFTMVEQPNRAYLESHGLGKNSTIYKPKLFGFGDYHEEIRSEDDPYYDEEAFERILEIRENPDHDKLLEMIEAVNNMSNDINDVVGMYFNRENYLTWMATNIIFGNMDAIVHNYLLYSPLNSKTWYFLPWDYDGTLSYTEYILTRPDRYAKSHYGMGQFWVSPLHRRFFKNPENIKDLNDKIDLIMKEYLSARDCEELTEGYLEIYEKSAFQMPDIRNLRMSADEIAYYSENMYDVLKGFVDLYYENLETPMPMFMALPENVGNKYTFKWDESFDFQGDLIYYTLEIARDIGFRNIVYSKEMMLETSHEVTLDLPADTYYFRVFIIDEHGNKQINLENFHDPNTGDTHIGIVPFEVK